MIERYSNKEISRIWSQAERIRRFIEIEAAVIKFYEGKGFAEKGSFEKILSTQITAEEVEEHERITKHDVIAFIEVLEEKSGITKGLHHGITSSDILDTATALQFKMTQEYFETVLGVLLGVFRKKAIEYKDVIICGRTHNVIAEPVTVGLKILNWFTELKRSSAHFLNALDEASAGMLSGAVGTYSGFPPEGEDFVLKELSLKRAEATNQVIQRDIYARIVCAAGILVSVFERIAVQIRLLSHNEIGEMAEPFSKGQKGSSAMPHKKNPVRCERISGLSRIVRSYAGVSFENIVLWHERDISHSSAERIMLPDVFGLTAYLCLEIGDIMDKLVVNREKIAENLAASKGKYFSGLLLTALAEKGLKRKEAYEIVQKAVFECVEKGADFAECVGGIKEITAHLSEEELERLTDAKVFLKNIDGIFKRTVQERL